MTHLPVPKPRRRTTDATKMMGENGLTRQAPKERPHTKREIIEATDEETRTTPQEPDR